VAIITAQRSVWCLRLLILWRNLLSSSRRALSLSCRLSCLLSFFSWCGLPSSIRVLPTSAWALVWGRVKSIPTIPAIIQIFLFIVIFLFMLFNLNNSWGLPKPKLPVKNWGDRGCGKVKYMDSKTSFTCSRLLSNKKQGEEPKRASDIPKFPYSSHAARKSCCTGTSMSVFFCCRIPPHLTLRYGCWWPWLSTQVSKDCQAFWKNSLVRICRR